MTSPARPSARDRRRIDRAIVENLRTLRADGNGARLVAGSVTSADATRRRMIAVSGLKLIPRGLAGFVPLAEAAGFAIVKSETVLLSDQVLLQP